MVQFGVGVVVGASVAALLMIVIAPSRRVRAEHPLPRDVETRLLLGQNPDEATIPPTPPEEFHEQQYGPNELAELRRLGNRQSRRRR